MQELFFYLLPAAVFHVISSYSSQPIYKLLFSANCSFTGGGIIASLLHMGATYSGWLQQNSAWCRLLSSGAKIRRMEQRFIDYPTFFSYTHISFSYVVYFSLIMTVVCIYEDDEGLVEAAGDDFPLSYEGTNFVCVFVTGCVV